MLTTMTTTPPTPLSRPCSTSHEPAPSSSATSMRRSACTTASASAISGCCSSCSAAPEQRMRRVDLAHRLGVTTSGVARQLAPLERIGLVGREPSPGDARLALVVLTEAGARVAGEAQPTAERGAETALGKLWGSRRAGRARVPAALARAERRPQPAALRRVGHATEQAVPAVDRRAPAIVEARRRAPWPSRSALGEYQRRAQTEPGRASADRARPPRRPASAGRAPRAGTCP